MANRGMDAATLAESQKWTNYIAHLYQAEFDSGTVYATDAAKPLFWDGIFYDADGSFLSFEDLGESHRLQIARVRLQLSGVDQQWIANVLAEQYIGRAVVISRAFLSSNGIDVVGTVELFRGLMDAPSLEEDPVEGTCTVTLVATNDWASWERIHGRRTNDTDHQSYFAGDRFFSHVSAITRSFVWGDQVVQADAQSAGSATTTPASPPSKVGLTATDTPGVFEVTPIANPNAGGSGDGGGGELGTVNDAGGRAFTPSGGGRTVDETP